MHTTANLAGFTSAQALTQLAETLNNAGCCTSVQLTCRSGRFYAVLAEPGKVAHSTDGATLTAALVKLAETIYHEGA